MSLSNVLENATPAPLRDIYYGMDGVGKTSMAADAPAPIFLPGEDWPRRLKAARFPLPGSWQDVLASIDELRTAKHAYGTFIIDALDRIEPLIWRDVCQKNNAPNIEMVGGGFRKGYVFALDWWRMLTAKLEELQRLRSMHVILIAHARASTFKNPEGEDYIRWGLNIEPQAADLLRSWADNVLFLTFDRRVVKTGGKFAKGKGQGGQVREIRTQWHAAYDAKNRANLPPTIGMDFPSYFSSVMDGVDVASTLAEIADGIGRLPEATAATARQLLGRAGEDPLRLAKLANWIAGKIEESGPGEQEEPAAAGPAEDAPPPPDDLEDVSPDVAALMGEDAPEGETVPEATERAFAEIDAGNPAGAVSIVSDAIKGLVADVAPAETLAPDVAQGPAGPVPKVLPGGKPVIRPGKAK